MQKHLVSVIVPVYKAEKYLHRCINSILNQTYDNIEVILIDDGSPDNSGVICDLYAEKDQRVKVFHKKNEGVSVARNIGLDNSTGAYICFVDSDDYIAPNLIYDNLNYAIEKDADVVCFNYIFDYGTHKQPSNEYKLSSTDISIITDFLNDKGSRAVWNKFYKRSIFAELRFPTKMTFAEDWYVLSSIYIYANKIVSTVKAYYFYDVTNLDSLMHNTNPRYEYFNFICKKHQLQLLETQLNQMLDQKEFWMTIVARNCFKTCLKAYHHNLYLNELSSSEKSKMIDFIKNHKSYISRLNFGSKILSLSLLYCPIVNNAKAFMYFFFKQKLNFK